MVITIGGVKTPSSSRVQLPVMSAPGAAGPTGRRASKFLPPDWKSYPQERPLQSIMIRAIMLLEIE